MTEDEITEEAEFIQNVSAWPLWPVLPVKHRNRGFEGHPKDEELGVMISGTGPKVYLKNLYELKTGRLDHQLDGVRVLEFDSYEALVRAGWMGD